MAKRRPRRKPLTPYCYVVEIDGWDWSFSFGVNRSRIRDDPYMDFRHLEVTGPLLAPKKVKADRAELCIIPKLDLNQVARQADQPLAVGSLDLHGGRLHGYLSMPLDTLESVLRMLDTGKLRFVVMDGEHLRYRKALIHHYRLQRELTEDDLPLE